VKAEELRQMHTHTQTARPLGAEVWVKRLEAETGRSLRAEPLSGPKLAKKSGQFDIVACYVWLLA